MRRLVVLLALVAAIGALALPATPAAGDELGRDATRRVVQRLLRKTYPDLAFGNVACPAGISRRRGARLTCTVQLPGAFLVVVGTLRDDQGTMAFTTPQAVIPRATLEQFVIEHASLPSTADCGPGPYRVARPGQQIECTVAFADQTTRRVALTVTDTDGNVTVTSVT